MRMAMMAITTNSSINVKPIRLPHLRHVDTGNCLRNHDITASLGEKRQKWKDSAESQLS